MTKTTITETTKKYDKEGHLIEETTRTETTEDNVVKYSPYYDPCGAQKDWILTNVTPSSNTGIKL